MDKRVVIADDESIIRLDLKEILEGDGYLVVGEAARGDDALAMIREHSSPTSRCSTSRCPGSTASRWRARSRADRPRSCCSRRSASAR